MKQHIYLCVCILYTHKCAYIYIYICIFIKHVYSICTRTHMYIYIYAWKYVCICSFISTYMHIRIQLCSLSYRYMTFHYTHNVLSRFIIIWQRMFRDSVFQPREPEAPRPMSIDVPRLLLFTRDLKASLIDCVVILTGIAFID